jgi:multimeric flavodoxin WrbA
MNILVLNGSPKGDLSGTLRYSYYLEKRLPDWRVNVVNGAQQARALEADSTKLDTIVEQIKEADLILWSAPLYILLVSSQYKHFLELLYDSPAARRVLEGKYCASITTSINYFDNLAHDYLRGLSDELGLRFLDYYSAHSADLLKPTERRRLEIWGRRLLEDVKARRPVTPRYKAVVPVQPAYSPGAGPAVKATDGRRVLILTDNAERDSNLARMLDRLAANFDRLELHNLRDIDIKGGCLGCCNCGFDYECAYSGKDGFIDFYRDKVMGADLLVFAGTVRARQLSWRWRRFFDRSFFNTHTPVLMGKQLAFLISGPLSQLPEMRQVYRGWVELQRAHLVDFISDEAADSAELDARIDDLARRMLADAARGYVRPRTFLGVGGMKIFRDDIWGHLRFLFQADHKAYKRRGYYDFPQKRLGMRLKRSIMYLFAKLPGIKPRFKEILKDKMVEPLDKVLAETAIITEEA